MKSETVEALWLDRHAEVSLVQLVEASGWTEAELRELVDYGAFAPRNPQEALWMFDGNCMVVVRTAQRLRRDFDLDLFSVALALGFLGRIRELEAQLDELRAQLPRRTL